VEVIHSKNVAAMIPGATRPQESVIYSAHWDHLGVGEADARRPHLQRRARQCQRHGIAGGTGARLGLAPRPARSVVFLAVTAEERGLLGSTYYAQNPLFPLATTAGVINMDGPFNPGGPTRLHHLGQRQTGPAGYAGGRRQGARPALHARSAPGGGRLLPFRPFPFAKVGVPAVSYEPGQDLAKGGRRAARRFYKD
jgi:Zn-dependent M28 family amino/carboxypeptidase